MEFISLSIAVLIHYILNTIFFQDLHMFRSSTYLIFLCVCLFIKDIQFLPHSYRCSMFPYIFLETFLATVVLEIFMVIFWTQMEIILNSICQRLTEADHLTDFFVLMISFIFSIHFVMISNCFENFIYNVQRQTEI